MRVAMWVRRVRVRVALGVSGRADAGPALVVPRCVVRWMVRNASSVYACVCVRVCTPPDLPLFLAVDVHEPRTRVALTTVAIQRLLRSDTVCMSLDAVSSNYRTTEAGNDYSGSCDDSVPG